MSILSCRRARTASILISFDGLQLWVGLSGGFARRQGDRVEVHGALLAQRSCRVGGSVWLDRTRCTLARTTGRNSSIMMRGHAGTILRAHLPKSTSGRRKQFRPARLVLCRFSPPTSRGFREETRAQNPRTRKIKGYMSWMHL
ncbi:hypothetical protein BV25DRAFT_1231852 [Artomyces pyxidatus]|uniref:Uncharacterized protein n=1 Tax=Artomyces pyxidatus TaxID=48021 RepID=A0ACB8SPZ7_9AGAM|nr:hypothetical protein BV25DRAFT_1231852 [Artomyces pyxidatus]